ncbi:BREX-2 system phosphatase PglZ [Pseudonocardia sp.]|uniref:BREX-2 system phosphatase PglZ n=1 Tax=Pseudonocardia sp. TaxID=60912 RepID=UPI00261FE5DC|nr:BREX-2 system phosphatase PglZ [Pseudonocardia sp.]
MASPARSTGSENETPATGYGAAERAVLARVRSQLGRLGPATALGIRSSGRPRWQGPAEIELDGRTVRVVPAPSVLAVLAALADDPALDSARVGDAAPVGRRARRLTVVLTDRSESELGDAVLARLHRGRLLDADRHTLLSDMLRVRDLDPRIRGTAWLVDALLALDAGNLLPAISGAALGLRRARSLVVAARLDLDPDDADLPQLVGALDATDRRARWRGLPEEERHGLRAHLEERLGPAAGIVVRLAQQRDDVLADLLVAQTLTAAPEDDVVAAGALGGFLQSRFDAPRPGRAALQAAGRAAVEHVVEAPAARRTQQLRQAGVLLEELGAAALAAYSGVLPGGFTERLARAARSLDEADLHPVEQHRDARAEEPRVARVRAAVRLHRWLASRPRTGYPTTAEAVAAHAEDLARVDRELALVRGGDPDGRVAAALADVARRAGAARRDADRAFSVRLAASPETPETLLAVETLLARVVAPLAAQAQLLLVVVDGMSGAVAADLADELTAPDSGWTEIVRDPGGAREAVLAAFPTETRYSRTSLLCAELRDGDQAVERAAFPRHPFWPRGGATLVHKSGVGGRDGSDLGADLDTALAAGEGSAVVAVVLNAVDDALGKGRAAPDSRWAVGQVAGLPALLRRAVEAGRTVVLTGDHGHVLEQGTTTSRPSTGGGARWRTDDEPAGDGEVLLHGPRILTPGGRAVLAATDDIRYGARAGGGYHGGATLAEAAIPLLVLVPPGAQVPVGWTVRPAGRVPAWWTAAPASAPAPPVRPAGPSRARGRPAPQAESLFELPGEPDTEAPAGRGRLLVRSEAFAVAHEEVPARRRPSAEVIAAVVDVLAEAGGRLPVGPVLDAAGASARHPRGLVSTLGRVLNRDSYTMLSLVDGDRAIALDLALLDEQFPLDAG